MLLVKKFMPKTRRELEIKINQDSAWGNIPSILHDIISRFNINTNKAIEFGVEYGYSTAALANYFDKVIGVDIFTGDEHAGFKGDIYEDTKNNLIEYKGIELVKKSYQEFITNNNEQFDFAHVDIIHTYEDTFACGEWCVLHSKVVVFHDTLSFPEVYKACYDLAVKYDLDFYNYEESYGLGILVKKNKITKILSKFYQI